MKIYRFKTVSLRITLILSHNSLISEESLLFISSTFAMIGIVAEPISSSTIALISDRTKPPTGFLQSLGYDDDCKNLYSRMLAIFISL